VARLEGVLLAPTPPPGPQDLPGGELLREVAAAFDELAPSLTGVDGRMRAKRIRVLLGQFAQTWTLAPDIARAEAAVVPAADRAGLLQQLADSAERRLAMLPRFASMGRAKLAQLDPVPAT
jgi:hypothetical protein